MKLEIGILLAKQIFAERGNPEEITITVTELAAMMVLAAERAEDQWERS